MSATTRPALLAASDAKTVGAPSWRGLLRAEVLRARSRRSLWWLTGLALAAVLASSAVAFLNTGAAGPSDLQEAADRYLAEGQAWYEQCMADPLIPEADRAANCWMPTQEEASANAIWYLQPAPFTGNDMRTLVAAAGAFACFVALMVGASAGGADWGARTMGLIISWEPRRLRVFTARLTVLAAISLLLTAVLVGVGWLAATLVAAVHGLDPSTPVPPNSLTIPDPAAAFEDALRWLPLGVLAGAGGYGVAMATRSTGWAIGATIALLAFIGPIVSQVWRWGGQWFVQTSLQAWLEGGLVWVIDERLAYATGGELQPGSPGTLWISQDRALLTLALMVLGVLMVAAALLRRRDVD